MFLKGLTDQSAVIIIIFDCPDLWNSSKGFESFVIQFIHMRDVGIRHDHIRQRLHITQTMSYPGRRLVCDDWKAFKAS